MSMSNLRFTENWLGLSVIGLWLLLVAKAFLVGLGLGLGENACLLDRLVDGEKHCFPVRVGDGELQMPGGGVKICRGSVTDRSLLPASPRHPSSKDRSSHDCDICNFDCTSFSCAVSRIMTSMPSSCLIWLTLEGTAARGDDGEWLGLKLALNRRVLGMLSNSGERASRLTVGVFPKTFIIGALEERLRFEVLLRGVGSTSMALHR